MSQLKQLTAIMYGTVQGVSFRYHTQRAAIRLGVVGWVANRRDGSVKIVAEADEAILLEFLTFLHQGPPAAYAARVEVAWAEATSAFPKFSIRFIDG